MQPFTTADFVQRMHRAAGQAIEAGLTGLLVAPGPDLVYFTGYQPTAITERITMLVLQASRDPALIVPVLERPDAEGALASRPYHSRTGPTVAIPSRRRQGSSSPPGVTPSPMRHGRCACSACNKHCLSRATRL